MIELPTADDPVRVIHADCLTTLRSMPDRSVDCVVTSPPYNQLGSRIPKVGSGMYKGSTFLKGVLESGYADDMDEPDYQAWLSEIVGECLRVCKGLVWINHKVRYRDKEAIHPLHFLKYPVYSEVVWDRASSQALNCRKFAPSHELIYGFGTPHYWDDASNTQFSVWKIPPDTSSSGDGHPCPFPLEIPLRCIRASCPDNGIVLDCFAGSGTTGHAAVLEGCRTVLIERDERYLPVIRKRMRVALRDANENLIPRRSFTRPSDPADENIF